MDRAGGRRMTIQEAAAALRARKISSAEMVEESLRRTARDRLNAFITVTADAARAEAKERGGGPAPGIRRRPPPGNPNAHQGPILERGLRTKGRLKILARFIPDEDA